MVNCFFSHFYQVCISKRFFHSRSSHFTFGSDCTVRLPNHTVVWIAAGIERWQTVHFQLSKPATKTRTAYNSTAGCGDEEKRNFRGPKRQLFHRTKVFSNRQKHRLSLSCMHAKNGDAAVTITTKNKVGEHPSRYRSKSNNGIPKGWKKMQRWKKKVSASTNPTDRVLKRRPETFFRLRVRYFLAPLCSWLVALLIATTRERHTNSTCESSKAKEILAVSVDFWVVSQAREGLRRCSGGEQRLIRDFCRLQQITHRVRFLRLAASTSKLTYRSFIFFYLLADSSSPI